jgi:hypothetical protein
MPTGKYASLTLPWFYDAKGRRRKKSALALVVSRKRRGKARSIPDRPPPSRSTATSNVVGKRKENIGVRYPFVFSFVI